MPNVLYHIYTMNGHLSWRGKSCSLIQKSGLGIYVFLQFEEKWTFISRIEANLYEERLYEHFAKSSNFGKS